MACGEVESQFRQSVANLNATKSEIPATSSSSFTRISEGIPVRDYSVKRNSDLEAVQFLQAEHEKVLEGLHRQIEALQRRCEDLQFEIHLRHVMVTEEEGLKLQLSDLSRKLKEKTVHIHKLERELQEKQLQHEDEKEQHKWREIQLQQQVDAGEQKVSELRLEVMKLKSQVRDLRIYSAALRTGGSRVTSAKSVSRVGMSNTSFVPMRPPSQGSMASQESFQSYEPTSIDSEEGDKGNKGHRQRFRVSKTLSARSLWSVCSSNQITPVSAVSLNNMQSQSFSSPVTSLEPSQHSLSRITLPPISLSQSVSRPQIRRQLRLSSAPNLEHSNKPNKNAHISHKARDPF